MTNPGREDALASPRARAGWTAYAKGMVKFLLWLLLLVACWPLALLALLLWPLAWALSLPFRLVGIALDGAFALLRALVMLPARLLGDPSRA